LPAREITTKRIKSDRGLLGVGKSRRELRHGCRD
jgi:hypothetical protein